MKHYVVVRSDLPRGLQAAEIVHAAGESAALRAPPPDTHAVVLVADPLELHRLAAALGRSSAPLVCIYEDTPPFKDALVAIGLAPGADGKLLQHLPLLGKERRNTLG